MYPLTNWELRKLSIHLSGTTYHQLAVAQLSKIGSSTRGVASWEHAHEKIEIDAVREE